MIIERIYYSLFIHIETENAMKTAIYARVSTDEQTTDNQVLELKKVAKRMGWTVTAVYADTISGAKAKRPQLDKLLKSAMRKEIDVVMAWSVDRLGRSLQHLIPYSQTSRVRTLIYTYISSSSWICFRHSCSHSTCAFRIRFC